MTKRISAPFLVDGNVDADARSVLDVVGHEIEHVLDAVGLDAQVVAGAEAVGRRLDDPVDVAAHEVQQFPADHGDLGLVDAVGAEDGAAAALGALVEVVEPLLEDVLGQIPRPGQSSRRVFPTR